MKSHKLLLIVLLSLGFSAVASARWAESQNPPSLVAEAGRMVPGNRGSTPQPFVITSAILKETRRILVALPASYSQSAPERRYPVTVVVDGEYLMAPVITVSDELSRKSQIPESVIVGIENVGNGDFQASNKKRVYDLTPPGLSVSGSGLNEGGDRFLDFIEQELLPAVDRQFRTGSPRSFVGISSGGILASYVAATRPTYRAVVCLDAPINLSDNWLARKLMARAAAPLVPVRYVSLEAQFGWPDEAWKALVAAAPPTWKLYRERFWPKESHESIEMIGAYIGLREAFSDYSIHSAPTAPTTSIMPYYAKVSASLGATVIPPKKLLQQVVDDLLSEGRGALAREAYTMLVSGYGAPPDHTALARIAQVERRAAPTETVEGLLATPFPTVEEARPFVGEWVGDMWMKPEQPRVGSTMLRIKVVDGRIVGETVHRRPEGEQVRRWEYLQITAAGMTWGFMNGMRPRGVVLFEGKLEGDVLYGKSRFGGIDFRMEDGSPPPSPAFAFKRVRN